MPELMNISNTNMPQQMDKPDQEASANLVGDVLNLAESVVWAVGNWAAEKERTKQCKYNYKVIKEQCRTERLKIQNTYITKLGVLASEREVTKQYRLNYLETKERCDTIKLKLEKELECFKELHQLKMKKIVVVVKKLDSLFQQINELENTTFDLMEKCPDSPLIPDLKSTINDLHGCSNVLIQNKIKIEFSPLNINGGQI